MNDGDTDYRYTSTSDKNTPVISTSYEEIKMNFDSSSDDDDEEECRVCRGPSEDGFPLFSPCRCSGSIGLVHQHCLKEWLSSKATRGQKCELCGTSFQFAPKYLDGAPERLRLHEVVLGVIHRGFDQWLPYLLRLVICAALWLFALPLATAYFYYGWLHHPSSITSRWKYDLFVGDAISGAIITSIIVVSFLSLMSFADFLRQHWAQLHEPDRLERPNVAAEENVGQQNEFGAINQERALQPPAREAFIVDLDEMDEIVDDVFREAMEEHPAQHRALEDEDEAFFPQINGRIVRDQPHQLPAGDDAWDDEDLFPEVENILQLAREQFLGNNQRDEVLVQNEPLQAPVNPFPPGNRFEPQFEAVQPLIPPVEDLDPMDVQLEIDEIVGLRGPIHVLVRNILLVLAFNATYLGIFAFVPYSIGYNLIKLCHRSATVKAIFALFLSSKSELLYIVSSLNAESRRLNVVILLPDVATLTLGYFTLAISAFLWNIICTTYMHRVKTTGFQQQQPVQPHHPVPDALLNEENENVEPFHQQRSTGELICATFQCAAAVGKVGLLLFLKMLFLPLLLGVCLDLATLTILQESVSSRITFAGGDLFGAISIHWVAGITFMLLVTVSVLQLREVVHPDLFARIIRPQEPQPDLLKNLLEESSLTHAKRMLSSLGIYMTLLFVHIWLPAKILGHLGVTGWIPLLRLRVWHLCLPQLLIPFQLLAFHLCMLALLEKGKNCIGEAQHRWLVRLSSWLGLSDYLLPKSIDKFVYVGSRPIFSGARTTLNCIANHPQLIIDDTGACLENNGNACELRTEVIDSFWEELEKMSHPSDNFIMLNLSTVVPPGELPTYERGVTKCSGKRHLKSSERYICLLDKEKAKIPTAIGPYRLRRQSDALKPNTEVTIEFWKEVPGSPIPRPPEGWDDLREDGAKAGRWAWGGELRSPIEEGVAHRSAFMQSDDKVLLWAKILLLLVVSWAATLLIVLSSIYLPIILGRTFFSLFSLPEKYHHDPLNFAIGFSMYLPFLFNIEIFLGGFRHGYAFERVKKWVTRFRRSSSAPKTRVLILSLLIWFLLAPLLLGLSYHLNVSKDRIWWGEKRFLSPMDFFLSWISGSLLFHLWAAICYFDVFRTNNVLLNMGLDLNGRRANQNFERINEGGLGRGKQWHGKEGRIGNFIKNIYEIMLTCEWEKVDHVVLLEQCAFPILRPLLHLLIIPVSFETLFKLINGFLILLDGKTGIIDYDTYRLAAFRIFSLVTVSFQLVMIFQEPLKSWFEKAHRAARDDRYLIGETLLNWKE